MSPFESVAWHQVVLFAGEARMCRKSRSNDRRESVTSDLLRFLAQHRTVLRMEVTMNVARSVSPVAVLLALCLAACAPAGEQAAQVRIDTALRAAIAGPARTEDERARDVSRHPRETLEFFGLRDDMHVVELWAPGGFYTSILAPVLRDHGELAVTFLDPNGNFEAALAQPKMWQTQASRRYLERLEKSPDVYGRTQRIVMKPPAFSFGPDASADLVLTFRNIHNWLPEGYAEAVFTAAFRVLKPGGFFGIVEHRGAPGMTPKQIEDTGYVPVDVVLELADKAGFRLVSRSEINANPRDTKDYPQGVWTLPPFYALKDVDRAKYTAIGESDRMTLKLVKP
jgi:predicted methyltransferase